MFRTQGLTLWPCCYNKGVSHCQVEVCVEAIDCCKFPIEPFYIVNKRLLYRSTDEHHTHIGMSLSKIHHMRMLEKTNTCDVRLAKSYG